MSHPSPSFPGASPQVQVEVDRLHAFVLGRVRSVDHRLKAGRQGTHLEYSVDGFRTILCRIAVHGGSAFLDLGRTQKRSPLFDVEALASRRAREFAGMILQVSGISGRKARRRAGSPAETRVVGVSLPPQDDRDVHCPICGASVWIWRLAHHAATTHGVRLERRSDQRTATCLTCGSDLRTSEVQYHACPGDHPRSVWTVSGGGGPGTGKRR